MIDPKYTILEDSTKEVDDDAYIVSGRPITLDLSGAATDADDTTPVYGLSKIEKNEYRDDTYGEYGEYGSRRVTVVVKGLVQVSPSIYNPADLENEVELAVYEDDVTNADPMDDLYVSENGLLTTVVPASPGATDVVGQITRVPDVDDDSLELILS